jgi:nitrogen fixation protein NifX
MNGVLKVAFATTDRLHVNQHFGSSEGFAIYSVSPEQTLLTEVAQFEERHQDGQEDKLTAKLALLEGCAAVYCVAVGGSAIRQLLAQGIQPVRVIEGAMIGPVLQELKAGLRQGGVPAWLGQAMQRQQALSPDRFQAMENEGWQE